MKSAQPIFFTLNTTRKPEFQLKTTIVKFDNGLKVEKTASTASQEHLLSTLDTYAKINSLKAFKHVHVSKPKKTSSNIVKYEFLSGKSVERAIIESLLELDSKKTLTLIDSVHEIIDLLPTKKLNPSNNPEFVGIFGKNYDRSVKCSEMGLIDLNFDNFVKDTYGGLGFFDYEWCFDIPTPIDYLKLRTLWFFIIRHQELLHYLQHKIDLVLINDQLVPRFIYKSYEALFANIDDYLKAESHFQNFVSGSPFSTAFISSEATAHEPDLVGIERTLQERYDRGVEKTLESVHKEKVLRKQAQKELNNIKNSKSYKLSTKISKAKSRIKRS